jgi:hypothetical protein
VREMRPFAAFFSEVPVSGPREKRSRAHFLPSVSASIISVSFPVFKIASWPGGRGVYRALRGRIHPGLRIASLIIDRHQLIGVYMTIGPDRLRPSRLTLARHRCSAHGLAW